METRKLKNFSQLARKDLLAQVKGKLELAIAPSSKARRENEQAVKELEKQIEQHGREQVIERVAYTWFNRFCALRYMDVNRYTRIGIVSPVEGQIQPEILAEAKMGHIDEEMVPQSTREQILAILDGSAPSSNPQSEAYQLLLVAACNYYHSLMPFMFETIADYTELLIPDDLLSGNSILAYTREALLPENCSSEYTEESVEVIGWLYQFYISEKKDDVFAALKKGKKITPENIPAATQLFTPHWIVRYLVENSLGRLWMLNHPDSRLIEQMDYYIKPEEPPESNEQGDFLKISSPEEIKICDPACGSGHMLTYAFDLLYAIYEEEGYQATDIPRLILTHNLYGVEIDQRAGALAAFALTMKAREKYRRFLNSDKVVQPNICVLENIQIDPEDLSAYMDKVGPDLFSDGLQGVVNQWEEADNFGSLIRPMVTDVSEQLEQLRDSKVGEDLFLRPTHQKVLKALKQAEYLSPRYHVVVANPPYLGNKVQTARLKEMLKRDFEIGKTDLFAAFTLRNQQLVMPFGSVGMMTPFTWFFITTYQKLRKQLLTECSFRSAVIPEYHSFFDSAFVPICAFVLDVEGPQDTGSAVFVDLEEFTNAEEQAPRTKEAIKDKNCRFRYDIATKYFLAIPDNPLAYKLPRALIDLVSTSTSIEDFADVREGINTGDNERFLRFWYEVSQSSICFPQSGDFDYRSATSLHRWVPCNKGGPFRRWYGNNEYVLEWMNDGAELRSFPKAAIRNPQYFYREGVTWSGVGLTGFSARDFPAGFAFNSAGRSLFVANPKLKLSIIGMLNSCISFELLKVISPTLSFTVGNVSNLPFAEVKDPKRLAAIEFAVENAISVAKDDWDNSELSWDFGQHPFAVRRNKSRLTNIVEDWGDACQSSIERMQALEESNNSLFLEEFSLTEKLTPDVPPEQITLRSASLTEDAEQFISYAVGCMLGRYSLDKPGLILANQGETLEDYLAKVEKPIEDLQFVPDEDNVIPLLDGDWFEDDITERFKAFLKVTFGNEHYEENLTFLENALYPENLTGKKRKTIRDYFLKDFYNHHIKLYKKRPIYWLFSSPKGTFNALIYMHRYREDTVSVVLNDYLREFQTKITAKLEHLQTVADSGEASKTEKSQALKEITNLKKQIKELEDYERDLLYPLASEQVEIDLDDGVKVNYNKLGKALKKVTGLTGKA